MGFAEQELKELFDHFDEDLSGSIDVDELCRAMCALSMKVTKGQAQTILKVIDQDENGTVEFDEFLTFFSMADDQEGLENLLAETNKRFFQYRAAVTEPDFCKVYPVPTNLKALEYKEAVHQDSITAVRGMGGGKFATASIDGDVLFWSYMNGTLKELDNEVQHQVNGSAVGVQAICPLGGTIASSTSDFVYLWDVNKESKLSNNDYKASMEIPGVICMDARGDEIIYGTIGGQVGVLNGSTLQLSYDIFNCHVAKTTSFRVVSIACHNNLVATGAADGRALVFDPRKLAQKENAYDVQLDEAGASFPLTQVQWCPDGFHLLVCGEDYTMKMFDIRNPKEVVSSFLGHTNTVNTMAVSPDGQRVITGAQDGGLRAWLVNEMEHVTNNYNEAKKNKDSMSAEEFKSIKNIWRERSNLNCVQSVGEWLIGSGAHPIPRQGVAWVDNEWAVAADRAGNMSILDCSKMKSYDNICAWDDQSNAGN